MDMASVISTGAKSPSWCPFSSLSSGLVCTPRLSFISWRLRLTNLLLLYHLPHWPCIKFIPSPQPSSREVSLTGQAGRWVGVRWSTHAIHDKRSQSYPTLYLAHHLGKCAFAG